MYGEPYTAVLEQIAHLVGHHPLALAIAAKRLAYEPGWTPSEFLRRLEPEENRLTELTYESQSIRRILTESFNQLLPPHWQIMSVIYRLGNRRVFRLENVAQISQQSLEDTADQLRYLYDFSLVKRVGANGYQLHPLVRAYLSWVEISNAFRWIPPKTMQSL